jgi:hypothetical protein
MSPEKPKSPPIEYELLPDDRIYNEVYANNVFFEPSAWDLKLILGQLDQRQGKNVIKQHTAVTLPWTQIKLLSYWLRGYVEYHETLHGKIVVPSNAIPPDISPPSEEMRAADSNVDLVYEIFRRLRNEFMENQKK